MIATSSRITSDRMNISTTTNMSISTTRRTDRMMIEDRASGRAPLLLSLFLLLASAAPSPELAAQEQGEPLFRRLDQVESGIDFANIVEEDEEFNINKFIYAYNGGGIAVGDVNNDGL